MVVEIAVADLHDLDRDRRAPPRARRRARSSARAERTADGVVVDPLPREQPRAQLAFLLAREPDDLAWIVGPPLHHRERLQHRVVQVRRDLGPFFGCGCARAAR